jgi:hypothetical protein
MRSWYARKPNPHPVLLTNSIAQPIIIVGGRRGGDKDRRTPVVTHWLKRTSVDLKGRTHDPSLF